MFENDSTKSLFEENTILGIIVFRSSILIIGFEFNLEFRTKISVDEF